MDHVDRVSAKRSKRADRAALLSFVFIALAVAAFVAGLVASGLVALYLSLGLSGLAVLSLLVAVKTAPAGQRSDAAVGTDRREAEEPDPFSPAGRFRRAVVEAEEWSAADLQPDETEVSSDAWLEDEEPEVGAPASEAVDQEALDDEWMSHAGFGSDEFEDDEDYGEDDEEDEEPEDEEPEDEEPEEEPEEPEEEQVPRVTPARRSVLRVTPVAPPGPRRPARPTTAKRRPSGADETGEFFPIESYGDLNAKEIAAVLDLLDRSELRQVRDHEVAHANRRTILKRLDQLLGQAAAPDGGDRPGQS